MSTYMRYFRIADLTVSVEADIPIKDYTFHPKFRLFETQEPKGDIIRIRHHFSLPEYNEHELGIEVYRRAPWIIYRSEKSWIYICKSFTSSNSPVFRMAFFNQDYTCVDIYSPDDKQFKNGDLKALTMFPTDQILLAMTLADRRGCYIHSSGVKFNEKGFLFVGHSEAGKSTMVKMWKGRAQILCDDRMIVKKGSVGYNIHGTWSHGEVPDVSSESAPLNAVFLLHKDKKNQIIPVKDKHIKFKKILPCLIMPLTTEDWWNKTLSILDDLCDKVSFYDLYFDKSGDVIKLLENI